MRRNKRSQHQLQQTVRMKVAVIQQQKDDLIDILNDFTSSVLKDTEQILTEQEGSRSNYQTTLVRLDKVSQLFTDLANHIDSTLYPDEDSIEDKHSKDSSTSTQRSPNGKKCGGSALDISKHQNGIDYSTDSNRNNDKYLPEEESKDLTEHDKNSGSLGLDDIEKPQGLRPTLNQHNELSHGAADQSSCNIESSSDSKPSNNHFIVNDKLRCEELNVDLQQKDVNAKTSFSPERGKGENKNFGSPSSKTETKVSGKRRAKKGKQKEKDEIKSGLETAQVFQLEMSHLTHQKEPERCSSSESQLSTQSDSNHNSVSKATAQKEDQSKESEESGIRPPISLSPATESHILQQATQPPTYHDLLVQPELFGLASTPGLISTQPGWAQALSYQAQPMIFPNQFNDVYRQVPLLNIANPGPPHHLGFPMSTYAEHPSWYAGQNLVQQSGLVRDRDYPMSHHTGFSANSLTRIGQPLWQLTGSNYLPQLLGPNTGQLLPPRQDLLVPSPLLSRPLISGHTGILAAEPDRSDSRGSIITEISPSLVPVEAFVSATPARRDQTQDLVGNDNIHPSSLSYNFACKTPPSTIDNNEILPGAAKTAYSQALQTENLTPRTEIEKPDRPLRVELSGHLNEEEGNLSEALLSPAMSDKSSVCSGSHSSSVKSVKQPVYRKSKKFQNLPADLKDVIKEALQDMNLMQAKDKGSSKPLKGKDENEIRPRKDFDDLAPAKHKNTSKDAVELAIPQLQLRKDEINSVTISNVDDPWAFHAQMTALMPEIMAGIQKALDSGTLENVTPKTGLFCLARFTDNRYYRAKIEHHYGMGDFPARIQVNYIDYGNKHWVTTSDLYQIPQSLLTYPAQAVCCALAKVSPATGDWTEQATRLLRQLTQDIHVHLRVVRPPSKPRSSSSSHSNGPSSPDVESDLLSPTSPESLSFSRVPYLVDIISRQGKRGQATSVSIALVKAGHAQSIEVDSQVEALARFNSHSRDHRLQRLQQDMLSMKGGHTTGLKDRVAGNTEIVKNSHVASEQSYRAKVIPACLQGRNIKNMRSLSKSPLTTMRGNETLPSRNNLAEEDKENRSNDSRSSQKLKGLGNSSVQTECNGSLSLEVDRKLRDLGQTVLRVKAERRNQNLDLLEESSAGSEQGLSHSNEEEVGDSDGEDLAYEVMVVSSISPSSFFVHRVNDHVTLSYLTKRLNKAFRSLPENALSSLSAGFTPQKHHLCCAVFSLDKCFYRGLVLEESSNSLLILFIDFGDFEWVARPNVYPLSQELKVIPPVALWCSLAGVEPVEDCRSSSTDISWAAHAVDVFKSLVKENKLFHIVTSSSAQQRIERKQGFQCEPLQVYLIDYGERIESGSESPQEREDPQAEEICVNYELIRMGLASLKGSEGEKQQQQTHEPDLLSWDPLKEEFESERNSYNINTDDPGVALVGYGELTLRVLTLKSVGTFLLGVSAHTQCWVQNCK
ncbi:tudor domain-containing protein 1 [Plakobranchus ocellatus]|uniref:Tudor domain-containing protein 1 n=1 Tax=Plakobranchus ocellatus TaxID=259542 RepID=A0AAV3Z2W0_9GAST|nr:tudor domain-containing protein 1 [Plakobranchus ocellatus]